MTILAENENYPGATHLQTKYIFIHFALFI